jgi:hypothetical protein
MTPEAGSARLPHTAQVALAGSAAEFIARQLDERARMQRSAAPAEAAPAGSRVRLTWVPIAAMAVPLLMLLVLALA